MLKLLRRLLLAGIVCRGLLGASLGSESASIATIELYNPTGSDAPALVEIPVGHLAAPNLVDWQQVQLWHRGKPVPFALREGKAHWKAPLAAPITAPDPEDLVVFSLRVPPAEWARIELRSGSPGPAAALVRKDGRVLITSAELKAVIDEKTGLLTSVEAFGTSLLSQPMSLTYYEVEAPVADFERMMGPSYSRKTATMKRTRNLPAPQAMLTAWSANAALTELHFLLQPESSGPTVGLTYRFYPNNEFEICSDERPWSGRSPWLSNGLEYKLKWAAAAEALRDFQTHYPLYGFRDYPAAVKSIGNLYRSSNMFELGEESINGRFWHRRFAIHRGGDAKKTDAHLALLDKGLVIRVLPKSSPPFSSSVLVTGETAIKPVAEVMVAELRKGGLKAEWASEPRRGSESMVKLELLSDAARHQIHGDGFNIQPLADGAGVTVRAGTKFGLFQGASEITRQLRQGEGRRGVPLVARNPVVDLRAGGFGGAAHEVDFPLGSEADWERAFTGMIDSGMNVMTDLGMWSNWKMPVFFKYLPELQTTATNAHDEVTGANFAEFAQHRTRALQWLDYLHARGVKVWLWLPVGAIPTTFHEKFPEATVPGNPKVPRFMHPKYRQLLDAYFKELLEVYPVDGFVLIRDDNGGIDSTPEFKKYVADSRTKHPVWEQYLVIYDLLRSLNFRGQIAVYPYFDIYEPRLETLLPADLLLVGHGSGLGMLTRDFATVGPMGDTWLDNLYTSFRLPTSSRMKRLLGDRSSYWIGGAYGGTELPWEAVGYFGWQPSAPVNTFHYEFGERTFGRANALTYLAWVDAYEHLWEIMNVPLLPCNWLALPEAERQTIGREIRSTMTAYRAGLERLRISVGVKSRASWFAQVTHYEAFFNYYHRRVELLGQMHDLIVKHTVAGNAGQPLPQSVRRQLIAMQEETLAVARDYEQRAKQVPGNMMAATRAMEITKPFNELFYAGFDQSLDRFPEVKVKQFGGSIHAQAPKLKPGEPFELEIELKHEGCLAWLPGGGNDLVLEGDTKRLGLPSRWDYAGPPMVFGDRRVIKLRGQAPVEPGPATIKLKFLTTYRGWVPFSQTVKLN